MSNTPLSRVSSFRPLPVDRTKDHSFLRCKLITACVLERRRFSTTRSATAQVAKAENVHLSEKQMGRVLRQIPFVAIQPEEDRGPLRRGRRGAVPVHQTVGVPERVHCGRGVRAVDIADGVLGGIRQGREHDGGPMERVRVEQRERVDRVLQRDLRERDQAGRATGERALRDGRDPGNGLG